MVCFVEEARDVQGLGGEEADVISGAKIGM